MLAIGLIVIGILLRFAPHAPNFTPVAAIALFSGAYLNKKYAALIPLSLMVISDLIIGMHNVVFFTWGAFALVTFLGPVLRRHKNIFGVIFTSITSALLFYVISNFGVWLMGWYPRTLSGLINCYVMALPFLRNFTLSTLLFTGAFIIVFESIASRVKQTKFSKVLLTN
jgi:hypothetical protein